VLPSSFYVALLALNTQAFCSSAVNSITFAVDLGRWKLKYSTNGCCNDTTVSSSVLSVAKPTRRVALRCLVEATLRSTLKQEHKANSRTAQTCSHIFPSSSHQSTFERITRMFCYQTTSSLIQAGKFGLATTPSRYPFNVRDRRMREW